MIFYKKKKEKKRKRMEGMDVKSLPLNPSGYTWFKYFVLILPLTKFGSVIMSLSNGMLWLKPKNDVKIYFEEIHI